MKRWFYLSACCLAACATSAQAEGIWVKTADLKAALGFSGRVSNTRGLRAQAHLDALVAGPTGTDQATRRKMAAALMGMGFDIWSQQTTKNICVDVPARDVFFHPAVTGVDNKDNWRTIQFASNYTDHTNAQATAISGSITYSAFSLSAGHTDANSNAFSSFSSYIEVNIGVVGDTAEAVVQQQQAFRPDPAALSALDHGIPGARFATLCGQGFITKVDFGEHVTGTIEFATDLDQNASSNSNSVSLGVAGIVGIGISDSQSWSSLSQKAKINYKVNGGPAPDADQTKWIPNLRSYGKNGAFRNSNEWVYLEVTPYSQVPGPTFSNFVQPSDLAQGSIMKFRFDYTNSVQNLTDALLARTQPALFPNSATDINSRIQGLSTYLDNAAQVYNDCRKAVTPATSVACATEAKTLVPPPYYAPLALK